MADRELDPVSKRDLAELKRLIEKRDRAFRLATIQIRASVEMTRARGATWPQIAESLGMTRQGVRHFMSSAETGHDGRRAA